MESIQLIGSCTDHLLKIEQNLVSFIRENRIEVLIDLKMECTIISDAHQDVTYVKMGETTFYLDPEKSPDTFLDPLKSLLLQQKDSEMKCLRCTNCACRNNRNDI